jgi:hypothetical protein
MTFDVQVIDDEKRPLSGCCVEVHLPERFPLSAVSGQVTEYTTDDGYARFETAEGSSGEVTVYVSGENKGRFDLEDGAGFTVVV